MALQVVYSARVMDRTHVAEQSKADLLQEATRAGRAGYCAGCGEWFTECQCAAMANADIQTFTGAKNAVLIELIVAGACLLAWMAWQAWK